MKIKIRLATPPPSQDEDIEALEKKIKQAQIASKEKKVKKKIKREKTPHELMKELHQEWVKEVGAYFEGSLEYKITIQNDIDRVDITSIKDSTPWRLCAVGLNDGEVDVNLFFRGKPDRMQPTMCFLNMPRSETLNIIKDMLHLKNTYYKCIIDDSTFEAA